MHGVHGTKYGRGAYFAKTSKYSHSYTQLVDSTGSRYMFFARVLVGKSVLGTSNDKRPPPLDPSQPHGRLYDTCVNDVANPSIFVVFGNHTLFWRMMAPAGNGGGGDPTGTVASAIARDFGSVEAFRWYFSECAAQVEGGGWAWLVHEPLSGRLEVIQGEKQQNLMVTGAVPILGIDVWEHAYYLKYQNRRADYIKDWWNVVNWAFVQSRFDAATA